MKALRYLLITFAIMTVINVLAVHAKAQSLAEQPTTEFQSTSSMVGSGSTLPQAVSTGAYTTYDVNYSPSRANKPGIRKDDDNPGGGFNGGGEGEPDDREEMWKNPSGGGVGALALLACAYLIWCVARRRARNDVASQR